MNVTLVSTRKFSVLEFHFPLGTLMQWELELNKEKSSSSPGSLVLCKCKLSSLTGIGRLAATLTNLDISCNNFKKIPCELSALQRLVTLNASKNFLKPNAESLAIGALASMKELRHLDIRFNERCGTQALLDWLVQDLPGVEVRISMWGQMVGSAPSKRDATLLRSQLEPWPTPVLRRRLQETFSYRCEGLDELEREQVMVRLLEHYQSEGIEERRVIRVNGTPVPERLLEDIMVELRKWEARQRRELETKPRERPSIDAKCYTILKKPPPSRMPGQEEKEPVVSRKARFAANKLQENVRLFNLAMTAVREVDPVFANKANHLAVTFGFRGSPHIDKQNLGPFYGLSLGDFAEGQGGVTVEYDARTLAIVNTKNRLGKVDGRFPHWVAPWDATKERFSLIYYQTEGDRVAPTTAIFPSEEELAALSL